MKRILLITCLACIVALSACLQSQNTTKPAETTPSTLVAKTATKLGTLPPEKVTPISTLSEAEARLLLSDLLKDNNNCQLPCWWGIVPGESAPTDLHNALIPISSITDTSLLFANSGSVDILYPQNDWLINIVLSFEADDSNNLVYIIIIRTQAFPVNRNVISKDRYSAVEYRDTLRAYTLANILSDYGPPSQILARADLYNSSQLPDTFELTLLYPEIGLFIRYNTLAEKNNDRIRSCPSSAFIELWLLSPDNKESYQTILSSKDATWEGNFPYSKPLEDVASITLDEFYQTFKKPSDNCLETPLNVWPGH